VVLAQLVRAPDCGSGGRGFEPHIPPFKRLSVIDSLFLFITLPIVNTHQLMKTVYLDNAATTPIAPEVIDVMIPFMKENFGNPSSTHSFGRKAKNALEISRRQIAKFINAEAGEIIFTSGGTEANNMVFHNAIHTLKVERIITSPIEHHAVGHTVEYLAKKFSTEVVYVHLTDNGHVDLEHLEELLKENKTTLVSLMHANNEIGNLLPLEQVGSICKKYGALFHSDTVQTIGHYPMDVKKFQLDFLSCSAHKFHGPKGIGFLYASKRNNLSSFINGGGQERGHRGGTENIYGIIGMAKAMELAHHEMDEHQRHVQELKTYMCNELKKMNSGICINGEEKPESSLYTVLNVCFPQTETNSMLLFMLDMNGIATSGGSACSSGSNKGSHVLNALKKARDCSSIRFSFSRYTTRDEIDFTLSKLKEILSKNG
jgi:cysteine desulfurase